MFVHYETQVRREVAVALSDAAQSVAALNDVVQSVADQSADA
jgi:hypothetical protein